MHNANPLTRVMFVTILLIFAAGCSSNGKHVSPPPETKSSSTPSSPNVNAQLEKIREKDFSILRTEMVMAGMSMDSPMIIRAFKNEMQLELWIKSTYHNQYELFKTYNICNKSGVLGPKLREGDKQTPEGFYSVTQDRLNPNSQYFLSFNIGFPNAYDRSHKRTGSLLMIHGSCVSVGCLAMTDKNIAEIYLIVEQNFKYGHKSIPIHIYPFRMTQQNMNMRNLSKWYPFWQNLKEGYDYFERYHVPPQISVWNKRYIFDNGIDYAAIR